MLELVALLAQGDDLGDERVVLEVGAAQVEPSEGSNEAAGQLSGSA